MRFESLQSSGVQVFRLILDPSDTFGHLRNIRELLASRADLSRPAVLDLSAFDFVNSSALGSLVGASRLFQDNGGVLVLACLGPRLVETLRIVRLDRILPFRLTVEEAVEAARAGDTTGVLSTGNPSLADVRSHWSKRDSQQAVRRDPSHHAQRVTQLDREVVKHAKGGRREKTSSGTTPKREPLPPSVQESLGAWNEALLLFGQAKQLSTRLGIEFDAEMSFQEFLTSVAERLAGASHTTS